MANEAEHLYPNGALAKLTPQQQSDLADDLAVVSKKYGLDVSEENIGERPRPRTPKP